jgi:hypothetical protein
VVVGLVFNGLQVRAATEQRRLAAAAEIVHSFQGRGFVEAAQVLWALPEGLQAEELRQRADVVDAIHTVGVVYETLGVLVHRRIVPLDLVQDVMGAAVVYMWIRVKPFVEDERARQRRASVFEWFQWLAERLEEHAGPAKKVGAHVAFRHWTP